MNTASGNNATIGGGFNNTGNGGYTTVGGGYHNRAVSLEATIGGGTEISVTGRGGTVAGGSGIAVTGDYASVGGGVANTASGVHATIGGGWLNDAAGHDSTVGGGYYNETSAAYATIAGGGPSNPSGDPQGTRNRVTDNYGTVGGGGSNLAGNNAGTTDDAPYATASGGYHNTASGAYATVGGGFSNYASRAHAVIVGGYLNWADGEDATVGGGYSNTAGAARATVGGGYANAANGNAAAVPGGANNTANGAYSFAAGAQAYAAHTGSFVWSSGTATASERDNQFRARAGGGVRFDVNNNRWVNIWDDGTDLISTSTGAHLTVGGMWSNASDRNAKENFVALDGNEVLARLAVLPITTWSYKAEGAGIRHAGPTAQDFYAAFGLGDSDTSIGTVDVDGIALASIQGLYQIVQEKDATIAAQQNEIDALKQHNTDMEARLSALEARVNGGASSGMPMFNNWALTAIASIGLMLGVVIVRRGGALRRQS